MRPTTRSFLASPAVRLSLAAGALAALLPLRASGEAGTNPTPAPAAPKLADAPIADDEELIARIDVTHGKEAVGSIEIRLHHKYAPLHVHNFVKLAESGFYDGTVFHRAGPESFLQGGDPLSRDADWANDGTGGPGYDLTPEPNDKPHERGAVAAASMGKRDSGSQFFIDLKDHPEWNGKYTVFGSVISGLEIADRIAKGPRKGEHPQEAYAITVKVEKRVKKQKLY